jgi:hypothetical protein
LLVGSNATISFANDAAKTMLKDGSLIRQERNKLRAVAPEGDRILRDIFVAAAKVTPRSVCAVSRFH